jgi:DNA-binding CsgD family transcriptional regulator
MHMQPSLERAQQLAQRLAGVKSTGGAGADTHTAREREVAALIAGGFSNRQIAAAMVITEGTAEVHVKHILNKLGFRSRAQAAVWAVEHGLAHIAPPAWRQRSSLIVGASHDSVVAQFGTSLRKRSMRRTSHGAVVSST